MVYSHFIGSSSPLDITVTISNAGGEGVTAIGNFTSWRKLYNFVRERHGTNVPSARSRIYQRPLLRASPNYEG